MENRKETIYTNLFEDEISGIIRENIDSISYIYFDGVTYEIPHSLFEDGMISENRPSRIGTLDGIYAAFDDANRNRGIIGIYSLINKLAHNTFTIVTYN